MDSKIHKTLSRLSCVARVDYNFWHKKTVPGFASAWNRFLCQGNFFLGMLSQLIY